MADAISTNEWHELARDQLGVADALGFDRFITGGASMGAAASLHVASLAPERVRALILAIPPTAWEARARQAHAWAAVADAVDRIGHEAFATMVTSRPPPDPFRDDPDSFYASRLDGLAQLDPIRLAVAFRTAARANLPPVDVLATVSVPTLILAWTGDPVHPVDTVSTLVEVMPCATAHVARSPAQLASWPALTRAFVEQLDV